MQEKVELSVERSTEEKMSLKEMILSARRWLQYLLSKWYVIVLVALLGSALGLFYAIRQKDKYTATTSFVLETGGKTGGLGAYAGIASTFGIDLGGGGGGLFEGENILELYKSRKMITTALLSEATFNGKKQLLVDRYIESSNLRERWSKNNTLGNVRFNANQTYSSPQSQLVHDSIMGRIVNDINTNCLRVEKKDKKLNIITISVLSADELFAKSFNEQIVSTVNEFYLKTKTQKALENVALLQTKTDSVKSVLSGSIARGAAVADATPNQNPTRMAQRIVPVQNARVNAEISQGMLASLIQNLEMGKLALQKETPLIQIVDGPILPLDKKGFGKLKGLILGGLLGSFLVLGYLIIRRIIMEAVQ